MRIINTAIQAAVINKKAIARVERWIGEKDLRLFADSGNEIGEEIEAEKRIRSFMSCGEDNRLQLCYQHSESR